MKPNFFLIGAPKCATSALATYLREHPRVFLTEPKEPSYLGEELRPIARQFGIVNDDDYDRLYTSADPELHAVAGEASTLYLSSSSAINSITEKYPGAKLVAVVRNPVDAAYAFHMQMRLTLHEPVEDFEEAWELQDRRLKKEMLPTNCRVPRLLQYREIASFGSQLEKLYQRFERKQILVLVHDDFRTNISTAYRRILEFVGLPDDGRMSFPKINEANVSRSVFLNRTYQSSPLQKARLWLKRRLPDRALNLLRPVSRNVLRKSAERKPLALPLREKLTSEFHEEIDKMSILLEREFSSWK